MVYVFYSIMCIGFVFIFTSVIGLIRIKNEYQMLHIVAINDMLGAPLFLLGLSGVCFIENQNVLALKIIILVLISYCVSIINSFILIKIKFYHLN